MICHRIVTASQFSWVLRPTTSVAMSATARTSGAPAYDLLLNGRILPSDPRTFPSFSGTPRDSPFEDVGHTVGNPTQTDETSCRAEEIFGGRTYSWLNSLSKVIGVLRLLLSNMLKSLQINIISVIIVRCL